MAYTVAGGAEIKDERKITVPKPVREPISRGKDGRTTFWHIHNDTGFVAISDQTLDPERFEFYDNTLFYEKKNEEDRDVRPPNAVVEDATSPFQQGEWVFFVEATEENSNICYLLHGDDFTRVINGLITMYQTHQDGQIPASTVVEEAARKTVQPAEPQEDDTAVDSDAGRLIDSSDRKDREVSDHVLYWGDLNQLADLREEAYDSLAERITAAEAPKSIREFAVEEFASGDYDIDTVDSDIVRRLLELPEPDIPGR